VIFFLTVNLRRRLRRFNESEYALLIDVLEASRRRLGFLLYGYVLMPDHWHALIWPPHPLLIEQVLHDAKRNHDAAPSRPARDLRTALAASILGSFCPPSEGIQ